MFSNVANSFWWCLQNILLVRALDLLFGPSDWGHWCQRCIQHMNVWCCHHFSLLCSGMLDVCWTFPHAAWKKAWVDYVCNLMLVCWKRKASIGERLKTIHWTVIIWCNFGVGRGVSVLTQSQLADSFDALRLSFLIGLFWHRLMNVSFWST